MCGRVIFETYFRMYQHLTKVHICHAHFGAFSFLVSVVFHLIIKYLCQYLLCELVTAPCPICTRYFGTSFFSWINNRFWRNYQGWNWIFQGTWEIKSLYHCRKFHWILFPSRRVFVHSCHAEDGYGQMSSMLTQLRNTDIIFVPPSFGASCFDSRVLDYGFDSTLISFIIPNAQHWNDSKIWKMIQQSGIFLFPGHELVWVIYRVDFYCQFFSLHSIISWINCRTDEKPFFIIIENNPNAII